MADSYVPGALTSLLRSTQTNDEPQPQLKKGKKRKKNVESIHEAQQSTVENTSFLKIPELPSGSDVIVPKKTKIEEDKNEEESQKYPPNKTTQRLIRVRKQKLTNADNERTVFVGNAPVSASRKSIRKLFSKFGKIESVRLRSVISGHEKTSKKVAALTNDFSSKMHSLHFYVKFEDVTCAHEALQMNGEIVDAHRLRVDGCDKKRNYNAQTTVFVGNIPFDAKEDQLHTHFEKCGDVSCVRIVRDRNTGMGKGFAFVSFKDTASVPMALKMDGSTFRERQLRITGIQKKKTRMAAATVRVSTAKKRTKRPAVMRRKLGQKASTMKGKTGPEMRSLQKKLKRRKSRKTPASIMS